MTDTDLDPADIASMLDLVTAEIRKVVRDSSLDEYDRQADLDHWRALTRKLRAIQKTTEDAWKASFVAAQQADKSERDEDGEALARAEAANERSIENANHWASLV